jgi:hypothetical protein
MAVLSIFAIPLGRFLLGRQSNLVEPITQGEISFLEEIYLKDGLKKRQLKIPSTIEIVKKAGLWHENSFAAELIAVLERDGVQEALALIQNQLKTNASSSPDLKRDESISEKAELSTQRYQGTEEILKAIEEHKSFSKNLGKGVIELILKYLSGQNVILSDHMAMLMRKEGLIGENNLLNPSLVKLFEQDQMRLESLPSSWLVKLFGSSGK